MNNTYTYNISQTLNDKVDADRLSKEIRSSDITISLDHISEINGIILIIFKAELSDDEENILNNIIENHTGETIKETQIVKAQILSAKYDTLENLPSTKGIYESQTFTLSVDSSFNEMIIKFPFDILLISGTLFITEKMVGDEINLHIAPNTLIGAITQPLNIGDTSCHVSDTVVKNTTYGEYLNIYTPGEDSCGNLISRIKSVDAENKKIIFINPSDVSANPGTYVSKTFILLPKLYLPDITTIAIGNHVSSAQFIPEGIAIHVHYLSKNDILDGKKVTFFLEYYY